MKYFIKTKKRLLHITLLMLSLWVVGFFWFVSTVPSQLPKITKQLDAVIVFTGGSERIAAGLDLAIKTNAGVLFVSGVGNGVSEQDLLKKNIEIPLSLGRKAKNTIQNVDETIEWLKNKDISHIAIVTAFYHIPRVILEFQKVNYNMDKIVFYPVYPKLSPLENWWQHKSSILLLMSEYHKYIFRKISI